jgi:hypothetical protein
MLGQGQPWCRHSSWFERRKGNIVKRLLLATAGLILSAGFASAAVTTDQLVAAYQADGYTTIDVKSGVSQIKVEAIKDMTKVEVVYDIASGAILSQEQSAAGAGDANQGVETATLGQDFVTGGGSAEGDDSATGGGDSGSDGGAGSDGGSGSDGANGDGGAEHGSGGGDGGGSSGSDHSGSGGSGGDD